MNRPHRLDLMAGLTLFIIGLAIVGLILYSNSMGILVSLQTGNPREAISPYEPITLQFSEPVISSNVENQLIIQPETPGALTWLDTRTAQFIPQQPFQGAITIQLMPGPIGQSGAWLRRALSWSLTVRPPKIVYLSYADPQRELMSVPFTGGKLQQITHASGRVFEFSVSPSGDLIAYAALNEQQGIDLWLVGRTGENSRLLLECGASRCSSPAWSPDGQTLAYLRADPFGAGGQFGPTRPHIIHLQNGEDRSLFATPEQIGYGAVWSPDGKWLACYDGVNAALHVVQLETGEDVILKSNYGTTGAWSPDSRYFFYANIVTNAHSEPRTLLYRADFKTGDIEALLGKETDAFDAAFALPAWSPRGDQFVIGLRSETGGLAHQLWLVNPVSLGGPMIASEPGFTYDFYQWDPWGTALVFQQSNLTSEYRPSAIVWTPIQGLHILAENALTPRWLP